MALERDHILDMCNPLNFTASYAAWQPGFPLRSPNTSTMTRINMWRLGYIVCTCQTRAAWLNILSTYRTFKSTRCKMKAPGLYLRAKLPMSGRNILATSNIKAVFERVRLSRLNAFIAVCTLNVKTLWNKGEKGLQWV